MDFRALGKTTFVKKIFLGHLSGWKPSKGGDYCSHLINRKSRGFSGGGHKDFLIL